MDKDKKSDDKEINLNMLNQQDVDLDMEIFGTKWKLGPVKMFVDGTWVELQGLVPHDEEGDPILFSLDRVRGMQPLPQIPPDFSQYVVTTEPIAEFEVLLSPEEQESLNIPSIDSRELFGGGVTDSEIDCNESTDSGEEDPPKDNPVDIEIIQDNSPAPDDNENGNDPTGIEDISTPQICNTANNPGVTENETTFRPETIVDKDTQRKITVLEKENIPLAKETFLSEEFDQNDAGLASNTIPPPAQTSATLRFLCEYCADGFGQEYEWKDHTKTHIGQIVHVCQCGKCSSIPYRDFQTMVQYHHNRVHY